MCDDHFLTSYIYYIIKLFVIKKNTSKQLQYMVIVREVQKNECNMYNNIYLFYKEDMVLLWDPNEIEVKKDYHWKIGSLDLWVKKADDEWFVAYTQVIEDLDNKKSIIAKPEKKPEGLGWSRFVIDDTSRVIQLVPVLQDRAIVVGSEPPVKILPGNTALFFVSIPVWVRVYVGEKKKVILTEIPTIVLSNTWFGDPMMGELGYSLKTHARRSMEELSISHQRVFCPVWVKNDTSSQLDFQRLSVHVEHLRVYRGTKRLWTNEVQIDFFGEDQPSNIDFSDKIPNFEEGCVLLSEERTPVDKSLLKKSVSILKYFTTFE